MSTGSRILLGMVVAAGLLPSPAAADGGVSATGGGILISVRFGFEARLDEGGTPRGRYSITAPDNTHATGPVTCFVVVGNRATIAGPVDQGFSPTDDIFPITDEYAIFFVEDNGEPGPEGSPDRISPIFATPDTPANPCPPPPPVVHPTRPLAQGNIVVKGG